MIRKREREVETIGEHLAPKIAVEWSGGVAQPCDAADSALIISCCTKGIYIQTDYSYIGNRLKKPNKLRTPAKTPISKTKNLAPKSYQNKTKNTCTTL